MPGGETGNQTPSVVSAPMTPGTPAPLLTLQGRIDSASYERSSMPRCKCMPANTWNSPSCLVDVPVPSVSITKKAGNGWFDEPGSHAWTGGGLGQLQEVLDISGGSGDRSSDRVGDVRHR